MNTALTAVLLIPRNVAVLLLRGYRAVISPLYGEVCRYYPSCSSYAFKRFRSTDSWQDRRSLFAASLAATRGQPAGSMTSPSRRTVATG